MRARLLFLNAAAVLVVVRLSRQSQPVVQSKSHNDQIQEYMSRFVGMVLRHKQCLLYTRVAFRYGCYCGVKPDKCDGDDGDKASSGEHVPKDCLDSCCKFHNECFRGLQNNCTGLEPYRWQWDDKQEEVICKDCLHMGNKNRTEHECHCESCQCDKKFAECFVQYPCPKMMGYLSEDECEVSARNITKRLELKPA